MRLKVKVEFKEFVPPKKRSEIEQFITYGLNEGKIDYYRVSFSWKKRKHE